MDVVDVGGSVTVAQFELLEPPLPFQFLVRPQRVRLLLLTQDQQLLQRKHTIHSKAQCDSTRFCFLFNH